MILVVDDDEIYGACVAEMLRRRGLAAEHLTSAHDALSRLAAGGVRAIVTDLLMPQADGIELLCEAVRSHPGLTVIGMTGADHRLRSSVERLMTVFGARGLLAKPIHPDDLLDALEVPVTQPCNGGTS